jgi:hypothetical protein
MYSSSLNSAGNGLADGKARSGINSRYADWLSRERCQKFWIPQLAKIIGAPTTNLAVGHSDAGGVASDCQLDGKYSTVLCAAFGSVAFFSVFMLASQITAHHTIAAASRLTGV